MPETTNPAGQGRGGRDVVKCFVGEADSTTFTPAAQALFCRHCARFRFLPALTSAGAFGMVKLPKVGRRNRRLCHSPRFGEKSGFSCFCQQSATGASCGRCYISAEQRPVSVRTGSLPTAGERCSAFFCAQISNPKKVGTPCTTSPSPVPRVAAASRPLNLFFASWPVRVKHRRWRLSFVCRCRWRPASAGQRSAACFPWR